MSWIVTQWADTNLSEEHTASMLRAEVFRVEYEGSVFLRTVGIFYMLVYIDIFTATRTSGLIWRSVLFPLG
jgi:hypothetical protein